jgi:Flp pilus assembly protein TadB
MTPGLVGFQQNEIAQRLSNPKLRTPSGVRVNTTLRSAMQDNDEMYRLDDNSARYRVNASGFLGKVLTFVTGTVLLVVWLMFSLVVFALAATAVVLILGYLCWQTREQRRQMRERPLGGRIIDGEVIRTSRFD